MNGQQVFDHANRKPQPLIRPPPVAHVGAGMTPAEPETYQAARSVAVASGQQLGTAATGRLDVRDVDRAMMRGGADPPGYPDGNLGAGTGNQPPPPPGMPPTPPPKTRKSIVSSARKSWIGMQIVFGNLMWQ